MKKTSIAILVTLAAFAAEPKFDANPNCIKSKSNSAVYFDYELSLNQLAVARKCGEIQILDAKTLKSLKSYNVIRDINQVRFFNHGQSIVAGGEWGFELINLKTSAQVRKHGRDFAAPSIMATFDSDFFLTEYEGWLRQRSTSLDQKLVIESKLRPMIGAAFSPDAQNIVMYGHNKIRMYSIQGVSATEKSHQFSDDTSVEWCADNLGFVSTGYDKKVKFWDKNLEHKVIIEMPHETFTATCSRNLIIAGDCQGNLAILNRKTNQRKDVRVAAVCIDSALVDPAETSIYVGTRDYKVYKLDNAGTRKNQIQLP